ncbi:hypothetical protein TRICI_006357 [Trichomonascus ciferrii]|uniref:Uncharacterized protein n=1 Tax=Trichomonascus ciferrii TaxID=44093 RepID=A0A642UHU3_9ASCO|nr:hypothetical protein TRICI_006357 [Trichomonascus ciferrii]
MNIAQRFEGNRALGCEGVPPEDRFCVRIAGGYSVASERLEHYLRAKPVRVSGCLSPENQFWDGITLDQQYYLPSVVLHSIMYISQRGTDTGTFLEAEPIVKHVLAKLTV